MKTCKCVNCDACMPTKAGDLVVFKAKVFEAPFTPYYDSYAGHTFKVMAFYAGDHVEVECVDDPSVEVQGHVHLDELKKVAA